MSKKSVLFVCTGNICRSPSAEGIFRHMVRERGIDSQFQIDSAGLHAYHVGEKPDPRSSREAKKHGVDLSGQRARQLRREDFQMFDCILAMDYGHLEDMKAMAPDEYKSKIKLFLEPIRNEVMLSEVPDPYYGGRDGFKKVFNLIERGCEAWLTRWNEENAVV
ncbi:MAG: phosphotyrosine protein phosphatase [Acidobacteria bacterium]|nr:MAG: phosphotyrosine protein phosphatase [Acidobacteriota bacterium]